MNVLDCLRFVEPDPCGLAIAEREMNEAAIERVLGASLAGVRTAVGLERFEPRLRLGVAASLIVGFRRGEAASTSAEDDGEEDERETTHDERA